ncbi:MAG: PsbP-related protein [Halobacteriota archaeon]
MNNRNLITALAFAALITVAVTTAGCATNTSPSPTPTPIPSQETVIGNNTTFSSAAGFNITYPKTLKIDSTTNASVQVRVYVYLATNNTLDSVVVAEQDLDASVTLSAFANYMVTQVNNYPNYKLISNASTTLGGKPAYTIVFNATVPVQMGTAASTVQETPLKLMQTFVVNNHKGYVVTYKASPSDYNTYQAQAQQIMNSFALT